MPAQPVSSKTIVGRTCAAGGIAQAMGHVQVATSYWCVPQQSKGWPVQTRPLAALPVWTVIHQ